VWARIFRGCTQVLLGQVAEGLEEMERAGALARAHGDLLLESALHTFSSFSLSALGDLERARAEGHRGDELSARLQAESLHGFDSTHVRVRRETGGVAEALQLGEERLRLDSVRGVIRLALAGEVALTALRSGDRERARKLADDVVNAAIEEPFPQLVHGITAAAEVWREAGAPRDTIEGLLARADEVVRSSGAVVLEPCVMEERARLASREDDPAAERLLRDAQRRYAELGARGHAERLAREIGC
jgi:ATP/maltotriose-dependent transcriptional regulator MalT